MMGASKVVTAQTSLNRVEQIIRTYLVVEISLGRPRPPPFSLRALRFVPQYMCITLVSADIHVAIGKDNVG